MLPLAQVEAARAQAECAGLLDFVKSPNRLKFPEYRGPGEAAFRRVSWQAMKLLERNFPPPRFAFDLDNSVERDQRYAEIRRVCRDAALAPP